MSNEALREAVIKWRNERGAVGCLDVYLKRDYDAADDDVLRAIEINGKISDQTFVKR